MKPAKPRGAKAAPTKAAATKPRAKPEGSGADLVRVELLAASLSWPTTVSAARAALDGLGPRQRAAALAEVERLAAATERASKGDLAALPGVESGALDVAARLARRLAALTLGGEGEVAARRRAHRTLKGLISMTRRAGAFARRAARA